MQNVTADSLEPHIKACSVTWKAYLDNICNLGVIHIYVPYFDHFEIATLLAIKQTDEILQFQ